ncbi:MAG: hypothetical protein GVY07_10740 [Bacteroidetes bacterium]|jgi:hypothetical protein|nr:hypothetical protein [Bacteroidota bacterium]
MDKEKKNKTPKSNPKIHKKSEFKLGKDPKTGLPVLLGPTFTKEDIQKNYPEDTDDRLTTVVRASVGL